LPSNGRLEADMLDRLQAILASQTAGPQPASQAAPASEPPPVSAPSVPANTVDIPAGSKFPVPRNALGLSPSGAVPPEAATRSAPSSPTAEDLPSLRQRREEAEKRMKELTSDVQNLEEILHNQAHPNNLAVVKKSGTLVLARPQANAPALFSAEAKDEFEILGTDGGWVHVQISGVSRGWIRRAQLDFPQGLDDNSNEAGAFDGAGNTAFQVTHEETRTFVGNWELLRGKTVRVIWVDPSGQRSSAWAKRDFAKSLLLKALKDASSADQAVAGVVIVFDSADGGQIASTIENAKQWQSGKVSEASFWQHCSLDPPELFQEDKR
jgi:hypothetical protein